MRKRRIGERRNGEKSTKGNMFGAAWAPDAPTQMAPLHLITNCPSWFGSHSQYTIKISAKTKPNTTWNLIQIKYTHKTHELFALHEVESVLIDNTFLRRKNTDHGKD